MTEDEMFEKCMASPEHMLAMHEQAAFSALDEIMALAADPETSHLVIKERIAIGQLLNRCQMIASFVEVQSKPLGQLRVISNG